MKDNVYNDRFFNNILSVCNNSVFKKLEFTYCTNNKFNMFECESCVDLGVFHINIKSLNKNHKGLFFFLHSL